MTRWPVLTDDLLREALTELPRAGLADSVFDELTANLAATPQARPSRTRLPWRPALPGLGQSWLKRWTTGPALLATVALLLALAIALAAIVGSIHRPRPLLGHPGLIAFDSAGQIVFANPDGTGRRTLAIDDGSAIGPVFSPDGDRLAYMSLVAVSAVVRVVVINPDGSHRVVAATTAPVLRASGTAIGWYRLSWSPDGRRLAYTAPAKGAQQIFVVSVDDGETHEIGDTALEGHDPAWSPDGARVAFLGGHFDPERGVFVMAADGSNPQPVLRVGDAEGAFAFSSPVWSPDGISLAFSAVFDNYRRIVVVDLRTGNPTVQAGGAADDWGPAWSPDGSRLAWHEGPQSSVEGRFVVGAPGKSVVSILAPGVVGPPTWSPDGASLIGYRADPSTGSRNRLVVIDVLTGHAIEIPADTSGDASWQRLEP
jgi:Tol biopolymer transport system component